MVKTSRKKHRPKVRKPNKPKHTKIHYAGPNPELFKKIYDPNRTYISAPTSIFFNYFCTFVSYENRLRENYRKLGLAVDLSRVDFIPKPDTVTIDEEGINTPDHPNWSS